MVTFLMHGSKVRNILIAFYGIIKSLAKVYLQSLIHYFLFVCVNTLLSVTKIANVEWNIKRKMDDYTALLTAF